MGNCGSCCKNGNCLFWLRRSKVGVETPIRRVTVAVVGLDNAGKTVVAKVLAGEPHDNVFPTIGFSNLEFSLSNHTVSLYDLGGGPSIRAIWKNYFGEVHGLVFVVDSGTRERLSESKSVLVAVITDERVAGKPLLILANKQDIPGAIDDSELCDILQLEQLVNQHKCLCRIVRCSAISRQNEKPDESVFGGVQWLLEAIDADWTNLDLRVKVDTDAQRKREENEKRERGERVQRMREQRQMKNKEEDEEEVKVQNPFRPLDDNYFKCKRSTEQSGVGSMCNISTP